MKCFCLILTILVARCLYAATYYVDYASGSDAANGTSTATSWKHIPGDASATGTPASANISGDTIYLKGGVVYGITTDEGVAVDSTRYSTSAGVTFLGGTEIGWGTGRPVVDGNAVGVHWFKIQGMTNVVMRGLEMQNTVTNSNDGALFLYNCTSNVIDSCWIHDAGTNASNCQVDCLELSGGGGWNTVTNCRIWNATQKCIETHDTCMANVIANNYCWSTPDHGITISSDFNRIYGNVVSNIAIAAVWLKSNNDPGYGIKLSSSTATTCRSNLVYNNVIAHCKGAYMQDNVGENDMLGNCFFNNTIVDNGYTTSDGPAGTIAISVSDVGVHKFMRIQNNIIYQTQPGVGWEPSGIRVWGSVIGTNNVISHNLWGNLTNTLYTMISVGGTQQPTLDNFSDGGSQSPDYRFANASFGVGNSFAGSTNQLFNADPIFTSYAGVLTLTASSPCVASGTNLSSFFTKDILGNTRSLWSMGAYEYISPTRSISVSSPIRINAPFSFK